MLRVGSAEWLKELNRLRTVPGALLLYGMETEMNKDKDDILGARAADVAVRAKARFEGSAVSGWKDESKSRVFDPVERPAHYESGAVECIDAIEAALGPDGFSAFLRGQVIEYNWCLGAKGPAAEDAGKARFYAARLEAHEKARAALQGEKP